jgi:hypothetical protein
MSDTPETETAPETVEPSTVVSESEVLIAPVEPTPAPEVTPEPAVETESTGDPAEPADGDVDDFEADELTGDDTE